MSGESTGGGGAFSASKKLLSYDQLGGYRVIFGHGTRKITFVTAHHAGHMVPAYQPSKGCEVFSRFIADEWG